MTAQRGTLPAVTEVRARMMTAPRTGPRTLTDHERIMVSTAAIAAVHVTGPLAAASPDPPTPPGPATPPAPDPPGL